MRYVAEKILAVAVSGMQTCPFVDQETGNRDISLAYYSEKWSLLLVVEHVDTGTTLDQQSGSLQMAVGRHWTTAALI